MIELVGIHKSFGSQKVLRDVNLKVPRGSKFCLIGKSGSGKSVTLKLMTGLLQPEQGQIYIEGKEVTHIRARQWNELMARFGVVFQGAALFDSLTIFENVAMRLLEQRAAPPNEIRDRAAEALVEVGLDPEEVLDKFPAELSGGMQKRVGIARAIIHRPDYLFYDEPTTGLDPETSMVIDELIRKLGAHSNRSSIIITHDLHTVQNVADRVGMIHEGRLHFIGTSEELFASKDPIVGQYLHRFVSPNP